MGSISQSTGSLGKSRGVYSSLEVYGQSRSVYSKTTESLLQSRKFIVYSSLGKYMDSTDSLWQQSRAVYGSIEEATGSLGESTTSKGMCMEV